MKKISIMILAAFAVVSCGALMQTATSVATTTATTATTASEQIQNAKPETEAAADQVKEQTIGNITDATVADQAAYASGQQSGVAIAALNEQYKAAGKVDMSNMTNLLNVAIVVNAAQTLKDQTEGSQYYKDFAKGLIVGSNELVSEATVGNVIAAVTAMTGVDVDALQNKGDAAAAKGTAALENVANIATSVAAIMTLFQ